jgi:outer membrane murein-binding lipoprotein Lpp
VDPETGEAINRLSANLDRVGTNVDRLGANVDRLGADLDRLSTDLRGEIRSTEAETRAYVDQRVQTSTVEMRRFFEVVGESLRGEIRSVAELVALSNEQRDRRDDEQAARSDGLERRVQRLEVDVSRLKADRKPRRPRRR